MRFRRSELARLGDIAELVRSKNAGPFAITIDAFFGTREAYERVRRGLPAEAVAAAFKVRPGSVRRFELPDLMVLKFSLGRAVPQGGRLDRDMHGAQHAEVLAELEIPSANGPQNQPS